MCLRTGANPFPGTGLDVCEGRGHEVPAAGPVLPSPRRRRERLGLAQQDLDVMRGWAEIEQGADDFENPGREHGVVASTAMDGPECSGDRLMRSTRRAGRARETMVMTLPLRKGILRGARRKRTPKSTTNAPQMRWVTLSNRGLSPVTNSLVIRAIQTRPRREREGSSHAWRHRRMAFRSFSDAVVEPVGSSFAFC